MKSEYVQKILASTKLGETEIKKLVEKKRAELKGLISEEGALYIVAKELGVNLNGEKAQGSNGQSPKDVLDSISQVSEGKKNIVLYGRIREIYDIHKFKRNQGEDGIVGSFILYDSSGEIKTVLWDEQTRIYMDERFVKNEVLKLVNVSAKLSRRGDVELHVGNYSGVEICPNDVDYSKYPIIKELVDIGSINLTKKSVNIEGIVTQKFPVKEFTRRDETIGKVGTLIVRDATGITKVTLWDDNTQKIKDIGVKDVVSITRLTPKISTLDSESIELHATLKTNVKKIDKAIEIESEMVESIEALRSKKDLVSFKGVVASIDPLREVSLKNGESASVLNFTLSDETAVIVASAWGEKAKNLAETLSVGQILLFKNVLIKPYRGIAQVSVISESKIENIG